MLAVASWVLLELEMAEFRESAISRAQGIAIV